jgi:uncharacterized protein with PQ loop repeat
MSVIEIIGWIATIGTLLSFAVKDMYKLRLINSAASMVWIVYGILKVDNPIIVINSAVIVMHLYWFYKNVIYK